MYLKILFAILFGTLFTTTATAQCVPDTTNYDFFSPASEDLPCVISNQYYEAVVQLFCPPFVASITLDSVELTNILNLPQGFTYSCYPANCVVKANEHACLLISGTTSDTTGRYHTVAKGYSYSSAGTISFDQLQGSGIVPDYFLDVFETQEACDGIALGITNASTPFSFRYLQPSHQVFIGSNPGNSGTAATIKLMDLAGRVVFESELPPSSTELIQLPAQLPAGTYCFLVTGGGYSLSKLLVY